MGAQAPKPTRAPLGTANLCAAMSRALGVLTRVASKPWPLTARKHSLELAECVHKVPNSSNSGAGSCGNSHEKQRRESTVKKLPEHGKPKSIGGTDSRGFGRNF